MHPVVRAILQSGLAKAMRIATSTTGTDMCYYLKTGIISAPKTTVLETRLKVESSGTTYSQGFQFGNGTKRATVMLKNGSVILGFGSATPYTHTVDTSSYHTYRIELEGTTQAKFYVDAFLITTISYANLGADVNNRILFGDADNGANMGGSVVYSTMRYNLDYVANPNNFIELDSLSLPSAQGWTAGGTESLATIIEE